MKIIGGYPYGDLQPAQLGTSPDGWDQITERVLAMNQNLVSTGDIRAPSNINGTFYLQSKRCVGFMGCEPVMEYISKGIHGTKEAIISGMSSVEIVSGTFNGIPNTLPGAHPANVKAARVGITVRYFSTTKPSVLGVGHPADPPDDFGVPEYPFATLEDPVYSVPYGWVLDSRVPEQLPGTGIYAVTDEYGYYWQATANPSL